MSPTRQAGIRRRRGLLLLALAAASALAFRGQIEKGIQHLIQQHSARRTLAGWGLEPTRENVALYLSMDLADGLEGEAPLPKTFTRPQTAINENHPFSDRWTYRELFQESPLRIGIYNQDPASRLRTRQWIQAMGIRTNDLVIRMLDSRQDLIRSFAEDTIVLYFGHANIGRGIVFGPDQAEAPIRMGEETLVVPANHLLEADIILERLPDGFVRIQGGSRELDSLTVNCRVFGFFGCRTDRYYRDIWQARFPAVDFIGTTYTCHATAMAPTLLSRLIQGLQGGQTLDEIVAAMNENTSSAILFGRLDETTRYQNPEDHSRVLFTCR